jgi:hypothetical protein
MMVLLEIGGGCSRRGDEVDMNPPGSSDKLDNHKWLVQYIEQ